MVIFKAKGEKMKRLRRSMLFCPANNDKMLKTAHLRHSDCIIFDLEDAVYYSEKDNARKMLCDAIRNMDNAKYLRE
jgi:citrate lyase subunit beta/citryl-CoA lyase